MRTKHIQVDNSKCQYCGKCVSACPKGVFEEKTGLFKKTVLIADPDACIGCFTCVMICPNKAISPIKK